MVLDFGIHIFEFQRVANDYSLRVAGPSPNDANEQLVSTKTSCSPPLENCDFAPHDFSAILTSLTERTIFAIQRYCAAQ